MISVEGYAPLRAGRLASTIRTSRRQTAAVETGYASVASATALVAIEVCCARMRLHHHHRRRRRRRRRRQRLRRLRHPVRRYRAFRRLLRATMPWIS